MPKCGDVRECVGEEYWQAFEMTHSESLCPLPGFTRIFGGTIRRGFLKCGELKFKRFDELGVETHGSKEPMLGVGVLDGYRYNGYL